MSVGLRGGEGEDAGAGAGAGEGEGEGEGRREAALVGVRPTLAVASDGVGLELVLVGSEAAAAAEAETETEIEARSPTGEDECGRGRLVAGPEARLRPTGEPLWLLRGAKPKLPRGCSGGSVRPLLPSGAFSSRSIANSARAIDPSLGGGRRGG